jgi:mannosyltransferase OCH1-like enzyme
MNLHCFSLFNLSTIVRVSVASVIICHFFYHLYKGSVTPETAVISSQIPCASLVFIPKIVHQTYKTRDLPSNYREWRQSCIDLNPDWEFKIWTDDDNQNLVQMHYPHLLSIYNNYDRKIKKIDMVRYLMLDHYGGVYLDMDMTCLRPFGTLFDNSKDSTVATQGMEEYANAFMASPPHHPLLSEVITALPEAARMPDVLDATDPGFLTHRILRKTETSWRSLAQSTIYGNQ